LSTSWSKVFDNFLILVADRELCSLLTDEQMTEILRLYLNESYSTRFKICRKDLTDIEEPEFYTQTFTASGSSNEFVLSQYPTSPNEDAITLTCTVNGTNATYTFVEATKKFTITSSLSKDDVVVCGYSFVGQFNADLDDEEDQICWILAHGCIISWQSHIINNEKRLRQRLTSKDFHNMPSYANMLEKLILLRKESMKIYKELVISYSFDGFDGFN
jgi:hypothetical protein